MYFISTGVRLGEWKRTTSSDCNAEICADAVQEINITNVMYHPSADIALLHLKRPIKYTRWIQPICLPTTTGVADRNFTGVNLTVSGWGRTQVIWIKTSLPSQTLQNLSSSIILFVFISEWYVFVKSSTIGSLIFFNCVLFVSQSAKVMICWW